MKRNRKFIVKILVLVVVLSLGLGLSSVVAFAYTVIPEVNLSVNKAKFPTIKAGDTIPMGTIFTTYSTNAGAFSIAPNTVMSDDDSCWIGYIDESKGDGYKKSIAGWVLPNQYDNTHTYYLIIDIEVKDNKNYCYDDTTKVNCSGSGASDMELIFSSGDERVVAFKLGTIAEINGDNDPEPAPGEEPVENDKSPATGDNMFFVPVITIMLLAATTTVCIVRRKNEN
ncbi:MAG: hypothetical protein GX663_03615 [Clostridiales bacterium]|nr:hypothetical protein [Clostridiales bacterium]